MRASRREPALRRVTRVRGAADLRALTGVVVAGLLVGGAAAVVLRAAAEWLDPRPALAGTPAPGGSSTALRAVNAAKQASAQAAARVSALDAAAGAKPPVPAKSQPPVKRPGVPAVAVSSGPSVTPVPVRPMAHLDDQPTYQYNALGRRDPFQPLVGGVEYVESNAPPDVGGTKVVGIVWGAEDKFAICEDARGNSFVLRRGDKVMNGIVEGVKRDAVVVVITVDGQSQTVTIPVTRKGDSNANR
ncbi:MAG: hypothetical protein HZC42_08480 [Candidatus Eisenbacteria bacterium]|nr:hypothetical protein [Candidatus Eisenbacteria bacterium]